MAGVLVRAIRLGVALVVVGALLVSIDPARPRVNADIPDSGIGELSVTVVRLSAIDSPDEIGVGQDPDFYENVIIDGSCRHNEDFNDNDITESEDEINLYSTFVAPIDLSRESVTVDIEVMDEDDGPANGGGTASGDDVLDVAAAAGQILDLRVDLLHDRVLGAENDASFEGGPLNRILYSEGGGDDGGDNARIWFYISLTECPVTTYVSTTPRDATTYWASSAQGVAHDSSEKNWFFTGGFYDESEWYLDLFGLEPLLQGGANEIWKVPMASDLVLAPPEVIWNLWSAESYLRQDQNEFRNQALFEWLLDEHPELVGRVKRISMPAAIHGLGIDHFGDPDQAEGFLFVPTDDSEKVPDPGGQAQARIVVFNENLELLGWATMDNGPGGHRNAGWLSVAPDGFDADDVRTPRAGDDPSGVLYTSTNELGASAELQRYRIDYQALRNRDDALGVPVPVDLSGAIEELDGHRLYEAFGSRVGDRVDDPVLGDDLDLGHSIYSMQSGEFSPEGVLYLQNGIAAVNEDQHGKGWQRPGIHAFVRSTVDGSWRLVSQSQQTDPAGPFQYEFSQGINPGSDPLTTLREFEEPEGLDWLDLEGVASGISGSLHALTMDKDATNRNEIHFMHYSVDRTGCPPNPADISIALNVVPSPVAPGAAMTHELTVTNNGPGTVTSFRILDSASSGTSFDRWSLIAPTAGVNGSCDAIAEEVAGVICDLEIPGELRSRESVRFSITRQVDPNFVHADPDHDPRTEVGSFVLLNSPRLLGEGVEDQQPANNTAGAQTPVGGTMCQGNLGTVFGTSGADSLLGTAGVDVIVAGGGNDSISGLGGNDIVCGSAGNDVVDGGTGDDYVYGDAGVDTLRGGTGNDVVFGGADNDDVRGNADIDAVIGGPGNDRVRGDEGYDQVQYFDAPRGVSVDLRAGTATGNGTDSLEGVERIVGSAFNDKLLGDRFVNQFIGLEGNDFMDGRSGADSVDFNWRFEPVTVNLGTGLASGQGDDTLREIEQVVGTISPDRLTGSKGANVLIGLQGADRLDGGNGPDRLQGDPGNDTLLGGQGADVLNGGADLDTGDGGLGRDTCVLIETVLDCA